MTIHWPKSDTAGSARPATNRQLQRFNGTEADFQPAPPSDLKRRLWRAILKQVPFLAVAIQFGLIVLLVLGFHLESLTFGRVMGLTFAGFLIHHYLPLRFRLPFFALLSLAATIRVTHLQTGLVLVPIGFALIGICHLPLAFWSRVVLLGVFGAILTIARANSDSFPSLEGMWPILGSMFIFRMLSYLYELKHGTAPFGPVRAVSYFFMIPNVCFPLFPVVDYRTFCTTHFNEDSLRIYQSGLRWMLRGIVQLLLYRLVYHFAMLDITNVTDAKSVARYAVATYLLYLHVSGQFHLIVGLLQMFGFNLPETHHRYLLASSFTDFWRRINIYWKDFILKHFFNPAFFALRRLGTLPAIALATLIAFFATWALHSWQWFWFRGETLFSWQDIAFWSILAILVLINALYEAVVGRRRAITKSRLDASERVWIGLKTIGTFVVICSLWTLWSAESWGELQLLAEATTNVSWSDAAVIIAGAICLGIAGMLWGDSTRESSHGNFAANDQRATWYFWRSAMVTGTCAICLLALVPAGAFINSPAAAKLLVTLREDQLNAADVDWQRRGYYEELDMVRANYRVWGNAIQKPENWIDQKLFRTRNDFLRQEMAPSTSGVLAGTLATTNRWGMRDREYDKEKLTGTYRFVLLGSSHEVGTGVKDGETFENLLEDNLNRTSRSDQVTKYEILNLSVGGYGVLRKLVRLERDGFEFAPDAVIFSVNAGDRVFDLDDMVRSFAPDSEQPFSYLNEVLRKARVDQLDHRTSDLVIKQRLQPYIPGIYEWAFGRLRDECVERKIEIVVLYRPAIVDPAELEPIRRKEVLGIARKVGLNVIDLSPAFDQIEDRKVLVLSPWDDHTNAIGHRLLADKLYEELLKKKLFGVQRRKVAEGKVAVR